MQISIYSVKPPKEDPNVPYYYSDFEEKGYEIISSRKIENDLYYALADIATPYILHYMDINLSAIKKAYTFSSMPYIESKTDELYTFSDGHKTISVGKFKVLKDFTIWHKDTFYVYQLDVVGCWLSAQKFQNVIKEHFKRVGISVVPNGYYKLDNTQIGLIDLYDGFTQQISNRRDEFLVYQER